MRPARSSLLRRQWHRTLSHLSMNKSRCSEDYALDAVDKPVDGELKDLQDGTGRIWPPITHEQCHTIMDIPLVLSSVFARALDNVSHNRTELTRFLIMLNGPRHMPQKISLKKSAICLPIRYVPRSDSPRHLSKDY